MKITNNNFESITIGTENFKYRDDTSIFILNIKLLNTIRLLSEINESCKGIKSPFRANTSIIYKLMDALIKNEHFNDSELTEYFDSKNEIELFSHKIFKIIDFDEIWIAYELDFHALGLSLSKFKGLNENIQEELCEKYSNMLFKSSENFNCKEFISEAKILISNYIS